MRWRGYLGSFDTDHSLVLLFNKFWSHWIPQEEEYPGEIIRNVSRAQCK